MRGHNKALGCVSLVIGAILSVGVPAFFVGIGARLDDDWIILAPGWNLFRPGRDDGIEIILATILDTLIYAAIVYGIMCVVMYLRRRARA
jgi:hypothetical protein